MPSPLRKVLFSTDYWHVVSDDLVMIVGTVMYMPGALDMPDETLLPWRVEYAPLISKVCDHKTAYLKTEGEAMQWIENNVATYKEES